MRASPSIWASSGIDRAGGADVARGDGRGEGDADRLVGDLQRRDEGQPDGGGLPGLEVADADGEDVGAFLLGHVSAVAVGDGALVLFDRVAGFFDFAGEDAVAGDDFEAADGGAFDEREGVDGFDGAVFAVDEGLFEAGLQRHAREAGVEPDAAQGDPVGGVDRSQLDALVSAFHGGSFLNESACGFALFAFERC